MPSFKKVNPGIQKTKCTEEVIKSICNVLRSGAYPETAAAMSGVSKDRFLFWLKHSFKEQRPGVKDRHYKPIYAALRVAVEKAIEEATARDLMNIDKCAMGVEVEFLRDQNGGIVFSENGKPIILKMGLSPDWKASAWRLERRHPQHWASTQKLQQSVVVTPAEERPTDTELNLRVKGAIEKLESDF